MKRKIVRDLLLFYSLYPTREIRVENKTHDIDKMILQFYPFHSNYIFLSNNYYYFTDFTNNHYFFDL